MYFLWHSLSALSLGIFNIIFNLGPLFTSVVAYIILNEKMTKPEIANLILSFVGVVIVVSASSKPTE